MKCTAVPNLAQAVYGAYGGALLDGKPIICGGRSTTVNDTDCMTFDKDAWTKASFEDQAAGKLPAYADYPPNQFRDKLFVYGSTFFSLRHDGFFSEDVTIPADDYVDGLCVAFMNANVAVVMGAGVKHRTAYHTNIMAKKRAFTAVSYYTWFPRFRAGCGKIRLDQNEMNHGIIVAGGDGQLTTEILTDFSQRWKSGPGNDKFH